MPLHIHRFQASYDRWDKVVGLHGGFNPPFNKMSKLRYLSFIKIGEISTCLPSNLVLAWCMMVTQNSIIDFSHCAESLRVLYIDGMTVTEAMAQCWRDLKVLHALDCKLDFPRKCMSHWQSLVELRIEKSPHLIWIPNAAAGWKALKHLTLNKCCNLEVISEEAATAWTNLEHLYLTNCERLKSFPESSGSAWMKLQVLEVSNCHELSGLPTSSVMDWPDLKEVCLSDCHSLTSIPHGAAGWKALKSLTLLNCNEDTFSISERAISAWTNLQHLIISESYTNLTENIPNSVNVQFKL
jgi:hypothetical protein